MQLYALFALAFASAPLLLNLAAYSKSQAHYAKGMRSPLRAPTLCKHMISDTFHSPPGVLFHLSLAVLVHYRSPVSIQPWRVVSPDSDGVSRVPSYLGYP